MFLQMVAPFARTQLEETPFRFGFCMPTLPHVNKGFVQRYTNHVVKMTNGQVIVFRNLENSARFSSIWSHLFHHYSPESFVDVVRYHWRSRLRGREMN